MSTSQDEVITKLVSVNAALDSILFVGDEHNETAVPTFEKSIKLLLLCEPDNIHNGEQSWIIVWLPWGYICILNLGHTCMSLFVLCNVFVFYSNKRYEGSDFI